MKEASWTYKPVTDKNWQDLEKLFESKGGPSYCWCIAWRKIKEGGDRNSKTDKKATLKGQIGNGDPVGILAYDKHEPVAWCSIAPRNTYSELSGVKKLEKVWSIVCFYIKKEYRKQGLKSFLIDSAERYAHKKGAKFIEAYPVEPDSPSYRFMGFKENFENRDYQFQHKAGKRRFVMTKKCNTHAAICKFPKL